MNGYNKRKIEDILIKYYEEEIYEKLEDYVEQLRYKDIYFLFNEEIDSVEIYEINDINLIQYLIKYKNKEAYVEIKGTIEFEITLYIESDYIRNFPDIVVEMDFKLFAYSDKYEFEIISIN